MEILLGEHGQTIQYALIGIIMISLINIICATCLKEIVPGYQHTLSKNNREYAGQNKKKCPVIEAEEIMYVDYKSPDFHVKNQIKARDCNGKDITDAVKIFGTVDTMNKGVYSIKCIVRSENGLKCIKNISVIVE